MYKYKYTDFTDEETESESLSNLSKVIQMVIGSESELLLFALFYQKIGCMCVYTHI